MNRSTILYLLGAATAAACASTPRVNVASDEAAIRAINRQMEQAVASRNADAISRLYATDAIFMVPNVPPARGQAAIRDVWAQFLTASNMSLALTPTKIDVASSGELATDVG